MTAAGDLASTMATHDANNGDLAGAKSWSAGGTKEVALHTVIGGAAAALGGGNALQGALGAGASEAAIPYLAKYGNNGVVAGTTLIGGLVGGGTGASTALAGTEYNYLTHQQVDDLQKQVKQCNGDQVCIEQALGNAEILSAKQQEQLDKSCGGSASGLSSACSNAVVDAYVYATDPLATKLGLQVDLKLPRQNGPQEAIH